MEWRLSERTRGEQSLAHQNQTRGPEASTKCQLTPGRHLKWNERPLSLHRATLSATTKEQEVEPRFSPSLIRAVANTAMGRRDVLPFWFGESDQSTPSFIREAAIAS